MSVEVRGVRPTRIDNVVTLVTAQDEWLATQTAFPEDALSYEGRLYRPWSPATSKLSSMITKGMQIPLTARSRVLYLGAASGTTVTHVSDIVADGIVFAVEFAPRPARDLLRAVAARENVVPMIADARRPDLYPPFVDHVDFLYQDVAQPDQAEIAIANADKYLTPGGYAVIAIKARSISAGGDVKDIFRGETERLAERFEILEKVSLEPLHHDHLAVLCRY
ncbi:MAG: Fibrillarin-like rRNA/tRNA 2'-O-methyltransferase [Methanocella sp. PtaU1.Bin125]|nr:MAG: Fibrillarin-like rRNA/tRNA 2'-O-methyltransferase [Methanocella sp. PtaU1.Bin125]